MSYGKSGIVSFGGQLSRLVRFLKGSLDYSKVVFCGVRGCFRVRTRKNSIIPDVRSPFFSARSFPVYSKTNSVKSPRGRFRSFGCASYGCCR